MILSTNELNEIVRSGAVTSAVRAVEVELVSICLHLDNQFCLYTEQLSNPVVPPLELRSENRQLGPNDKYGLPPQGKVLACSEEIVNMPLNVMGWVQTKGSLARGFLVAHACDGQIDPGYNGKITFEVINLSDFYYELAPGMPFASLFFCRLSSPVDVGYSGRYQRSFCPTPMR
jgi:dCTP deaminase